MHLNNQYMEMVIDGIFCCMILLPVVAIGNVVQLTSNNLDNVLSTHELVFVNFYADWCRFSQMLTPVFDEAGKQIKNDFPDEGKVTFGRIDCDREGQLAGRFHVSKYPTLKLFRFGALVKREYRGQRSVSALTNFIRTQLVVPVTQLKTPDDIYSIDINKRVITGYFDSEDSPEYLAFLRVASLLRDDCTFYTALRPLSDDDDVRTGNKIVFRTPGEQNTADVYQASAADHNALLQWCNERCVPLVRELTFENAEELTEEGIPFLILFHHPDDTDTPERFRSIVASELTEQKSSVNCLVANGLKFSHPLHHLSKTANDLPVLAIDSFRHMYVWSHNAQSDIDKPGLVKQFIADLNSGKLHREFHHGPDPVPAIPPVEKKPAVPEKKTEADSAAAPLEHVPKEPEVDEETKQDTTASETSRTSPPESLFRKLAPSRTRYTILRDEL